MTNKLTRRDLIKSGTGMAIWSYATSASATSKTTTRDDRTVRVGIVGVGHRGTSLLKTLLTFEDVEIKALADITPGNLAHAQDMVEKKQGKRPEGYGSGPEDFRSMVTRDDLDAVITATSWEWHTPIAVATMKAKKYAGVEVPAAVTVDECWELVNTSEATGMPCMMLENVCYFRDMLMVLNMVRQGVLGELAHCEAGYQHDSRAYCFDENGDLSHKFAPSEGTYYQLWYTFYALHHNGNLYPTHPIGPIAQYLNINRGDRFSYLVSMSTKSRGLNLWIEKKFGPDHKNATLHFANGDVNTSLIKTHNGCTVTLYYDTQLPRPYDLIFRVQGTKGLYLMTRDSIYIEGEGKPDAWENTENYRQKYEHPLWKKFSEEAQHYGHGGADYITLRQFVQAVRERRVPDQDVYDAATWSVIMPLSEMSVARGSAPVEFPDFTRGRWKSRPPLAIIEG